MMCYSLKLFWLLCALFLAQQIFLKCVLRILFIMFSNLSYLTILFLLFMQAFFNFNLFTFCFFEFILFFIQPVTQAFEFFSCLVGDTFVISSSLLSAFRNLPLKLFVLGLSIAIIFKDASHLLQILLFFLHFFQGSDQLCNVSF